MLSREYLIEQKECCGEGCQMCPYMPKHVLGSTEIPCNTESPLKKCINLSKK